MAPIAAEALPQRVRLEPEKTPSVQEEVDAEERPSDEICTVATADETQTPDTDEVSSIAEEPEVAPEDVLAWVRESWSCDEFTKWVLDHRPVADLPEGYPITAVDARFAHECATFALSGVFRRFVLSERLFAEMVTDAVQRNIDRPRVRELALSLLREEALAYKALAAILPTLQAGIRSGAVEVRLLRRPLLSGRYPDKVGAKINSVDVDPRRRTVLFTARSGPWEISLLVPALLFDPADRERLFPASTQK
ncbi:MAG: hypothetical protein AB7I19_00745 [Planctomycetota bacterium]